MRRLDIDAGHVKPAAAWLGEKLGRLKLNGEVLDQSPLSPLIELEALTLGVGLEALRLAAARRALSV